MEIIKSSDRSIPSTRRGPEGAVFKLQGMRQVSVIGASVADEDLYQFAYHLGRELGRRKVVVINGGRSGVMEAVSRGVREAGGISVGILTTYDGSDANEYLTIRVNTGMNWNRNPIVVASGEVVIAIGGAWGTLSELAYAKILGKRIIGYRTHDIEGVFRVHSVEEVLKILEEWGII